jgi:DNA-binding transcriptional LysR family regulator
MAITPTLRQIRTFLAVVDTGGVSAAARALHLTQPAVSQQLRDLERGLRVKLLDRAGGRSLPTAAGAAFLEPARKAQMAIDDAIAATAAFRSGSVSRVRLGSGATACIHLLPAVLAAAKSRMAGLQVTVATGNTSDIVGKIEDGALDLGLVTLPIPASRALSVSRLIDDPLVALIPEAMAEAGDTIGVSRLAALPLILHDLGGGTRALIDGWFRRAGVTVAPAMQLDSVESIKLLVASGLGASIVPRLSLTESVPGAVVRRLRPALTRHLALVVRREKVLDRGLRTVMEALRAAARE